MVHQIVYRLTLCSAYALVLVTNIKRRARCANLGMSTSAPRTARDQGLVQFSMQQAAPDSSTIIRAFLEAMRLSTMVYGYGLGLNSNASLHKVQNNRSPDTDSDSRLTDTWIVDLDLHIVFG